MIDPLAHLAPLWIIVPAVALRELTIVVHEWTHAVVARWLGYRASVDVTGTVIAGRRLPIYSEGSCTLRPMIAWNRLAPGEHAVIAAAPLALGVATVPIGIGLAAWAGTSVAVAAVLWTLTLGPSSTDWLMVRDALLDPDLLHMDLAIGPESAHVLAEGVVR